MRRQQQVTPKVDARGRLQLTVIAYRGRLVKPLLRHHVRQTLRCPPARSRSIRSRFAQSYIAADPRAAMPASPRTRTVTAS
ncbi:hypothetical protein ABZX77_03175 [Streptomyces sp. NPDC004237]|uniref:hypothetical protein n=1 Tax=Streptomyces sp. NPDC004237 TaxID=3154455 RepID=UPI0033A149F5